MNKQIDQHSENIEKEGATAFLQFVETKIKDLPWTTDFIDSLETDSEEFVRGDYDERIESELDAPGFAVLEISARERQSLEATAMFVRNKIIKTLKQL